MRKYFTTIFVSSLLVVLNGCTKESAEPIEIEKEIPMAKENAAPVINGQTFEIEENAISGTVVGSIEAQDAENDPLKFSMAPIEGLILNADSGTLTIQKGASFLDYETNAEFEFEVRVSDGNTSVATKIVFDIINVEDGPLTNFEKDIFEEFKVQVLYNSTEFSLNKWTETAKIFYSGHVTTKLRTFTSSAITSFNELFTDGFKIEIVRDSLSANVQLFSGTIEEVKQLWPDFGVVADENPGLGGVATIGGGRIWIADYSQNISTIKHEIGHMIGLNHANATQCNGEYEENSVMCGGSNNAGLDFTKIDKRLIQYYYHKEITNNENAVVVLEKISELMLSDREKD